jgi:uncharacterized protein (DUF433 family)
VTAPRVQPASVVGHDGGMSGSASHLDRITVNPVICHGKPTVRGLRMPVQTILELLASGMTFDEVLDDYPYLEREDLLAALEYGAVAAGGHQVVLSGS